MYRNLMAMDTEAMIGAQPMDAVVLIGGCDKTVPAQLMGAASAGLPAIPGRHRAHVNRPAQGRAVGRLHGLPTVLGKIPGRRGRTKEMETVEGRLSVTAGTCAVMGTASTMACITEALGMSLPGTAAIPAVHSDIVRIHTKLLGGKELSRCSED